MKRILLSILAVLFPWIVILLEGKFIAAMACLALQLTFFGWIPASIWAFKSVKNIQSLENNSVDSTQSPEKTQEENLAKKVATDSLVASEEVLKDKK
jgi:uncharacterized membrane protein YqaE (UPF0057 family)